MSGQRWPNAIVGITLANAGLVGLRALDQHRINGWQLRWPDEQNDMELTSFVDACRANKTADKMSALAQQLNAIWDNN